MKKTRSTECSKQAVLPVMVAVTAVVLLASPLSSASLHPSAFAGIALMVCAILGGTWIHQVSNQESAFTQVVNQWKRLLNSDQASSTVKSLAEDAMQLAVRAAERIDKDELLEPLIQCMTLVGDRVEAMGAGATMEVISIEEAVSQLRTYVSGLEITLSQGELDEPLPLAS
jgi:hypothetical protein